MLPSFPIGLFQGLMMSITSTLESSARLLDEVIQFKQKKIVSKFSTYP
jgi:hypothetical protein